MLNTTNPRLCKNFFLQIVVFFSFLAQPILSQWFKQTSGTNYSLNSVFFADQNEGWAVGQSPVMGGIILQTTDGGVNWEPQSSGTFNDLYSIHFVDQDNGWAVGDNGTVLYTNNGGVSSIEEEVIDEIPTEFLLAQNYSNPFNPSTVISYQLPVSGDVTLIVYDVLGNEVETLVDEYKSAGSYEESKADTLLAYIFIN